MDAANFFTDLEDVAKIPGGLEPLPAFLQVLYSDGPSSEISKASNIYGWLVGSWEVDVIDYDLDDSPWKRKGEWHFGWVLEGRAIQDIFIVPHRLDQKGIDKKGNRYGTTMRFYDPAIDAWHITWFNPVRAVKNELIGRRKGNDIVQEGKTPDGLLMRWSFVEIQSNSFHWLGEDSKDGGKTWQLQAEFFAKRK